MLHCRSTPRAPLFSGSRLPVGIIVRDKLSVDSNAAFSPNYTDLTAVFT